MELSSNELQARSNGRKVASASPPLPEKVHIESNIVPLFIKDGKKPENPTQRYFINVEKKDEGKEFMVLLPRRTLKGEERALAVRVIGKHFPGQPIGALSAEAFNELRVLEVKDGSPLIPIYGGGKLRETIEHIQDGKPLKAITSALELTARLQPTPLNALYSARYTWDRVTGKLTPETVRVDRGVKYFISWPTGEPINANRLGQVETYPCKQMIFNNSVLLELPSAVVQIEKKNGKATSLSPEEVPYLLQFERSYRRDILRDKQRSELPSELPDPNPITTLTDYVQGQVLPAETSSNLVLPGEDLGL